MRGREVADGARFASEKQAIVDRLGKRWPIIGESRQSKRIRAKRKRIDAPAVVVKRLQAAGKTAAEQIRQFRNGKIEKCAGAPRFKLGGEFPAEIGLNHRP